MKKYYLKISSDHKRLRKKRITVAIIGILAVALSVGAIYTIVKLSTANRSVSAGEDPPTPSSGDVIVIDPSDQQSPSPSIEPSVSPSPSSSPDSEEEPSPTIPVVAIPGDDDFLTHLPKSGDEDFAAKYNIVYNRNGHKCAYLTFDDGPSQLTPKILDLLKKYDIKATFFVVGSLAEKNPDIVKRASDEGHMIANHSYSHDYKALYRSTESFVNEITKTQAVLKDIIGEDRVTNLIRFPGGASPKNRAPFKEKLDEMDMVFIDWNAVNGDGESNNLTEAESVKNVEEYAKIKDDMVILMHDAGAKKATYNSLEDIIKMLQNYGFEFKRLNQFDDPNATPASATPTPSPSPTSNVQ